jgi:hypothetical protein
MISSPSILSQVSRDEWPEFFHYCFLAEQGILPYWLPDERPCAYYTFPEGVPESSLEEALKIVQKVSAQYTDEELSKSGRS